MSIGSAGSGEAIWFDIDTGGTVLEFGLSWQRVAALVSIWILTWINLRGVKEGKWECTRVCNASAPSLASPTTSMSG